QRRSEGMVVEGFLVASSGRSVCVDALERALPSEELVGRIGPLVRPTWILSILFQWVGDLHAAKERLERLRQEALDRGDENALPYVLHQLSRVECRLGRREEA